MFARCSQKASTARSAITTYISRDTAVPAQAARLSHDNGHCKKDNVNHHGTEGNIVCYCKIQEKQRCTDQRDSPVKRDNQTRGRAIPFPPRKPK